jgi:ribosomal protein L11 methylase PrmA
LSDDFIRLELTPEQQDDLCSRTGIAKTAWVLEKHRVAGLALLAASAGMDCLPYGPAVVNRLLGRPGAGPPKTEFEMVFSAAQREQIREAVGSSFRSILFSADDLDVSFSEEWDSASGPRELGRTFVLLPDGSPAAVPAGRQALKLPVAEAGRKKVFGTGAHPTTRLALELLEDHLPAGARVLDFGTGSGILAAAAAKLGARDVLAIDRDPEAVGIAADCARLNGLEAVIEVRSGDRPPADRRYGFILANLFANILLANAKEIAAALDSGGLVCASGVSQARAPEVAAALTSAGLTLVEQRELPGWRTMLFRRD